MQRKNIQTAVLILATFFNPLGFDALFALVMHWTGSYLITDGIFYCLSAFFFGIYFWISDKKVSLPRLKRKSQSSMD